MKFEHWGYLALVLAGLGLAIEELVSTEIGWALLLAAVVVVIGMGADLGRQIADFYKQTGAKA